MPVPKALLPYRRLLTRLRAGRGAAQPERTLDEAERA